jgi:hypothetical protein
MSRNVRSARSLLLFLVIAGCAARPIPISVQLLERGDNWSVMEAVYSQADMQALPVYLLLANTQSRDTVERAVAWCEAGGTPCCYQTQNGEVAACYQLVSRREAAKALGKLLRELLERKKKDATNPSRGDNPEQRPPQQKVKPLQPSLPPGFQSNRELGEFLKWPTPQNPRGGPVPSADQLRQRGITRQDIQRWQKFDEEVGMHNSGNPSADPRIGYLEQLKRLLD